MCIRKNYLFTLITLLSSQCNRGSQRISFFFFFFEANFQTSIPARGHKKDQVTPVPAMNRTTVKEP